MAELWHAKHRPKSRKSKNVAAQGNFAGLYLPNEGEIQKSPSDAF